jgi:Flp pilus assembly protein TadG
MNTGDQKTSLFFSYRRLNYLRRFARSENGLQLAELAIALPVFLLLFGATAEFGRFFYQYSTLAKATRVGARYLITSPSDGSDDTSAKNLVIYGNTSGSGSAVLRGMTTANVYITRTTLGADAKTVTVRITGFKYQPLFDLGKMIKQPALSLKVDVKPSVTMRHLPSI